MVVGKALLVKASAAGVGAVGSVVTGMVSSSGVTACLPDVWLEAVE